MSGYPSSAMGAEGFARAAPREGVTLWRGDCLELMGRIPDESVDLILTDPPYGFFAGRAESHAGFRGDRAFGWDETPDMVAVFRAFSRVLRPCGQAVCFSMEPLTSRLRTMELSNMSFLRPMYWRKNNFSNFQNARRTVLSVVEDMSLFAKGQYSLAPSPAQAYFQAVRAWAGITSIGRANAACGYTRATLTHIFTAGYEFYFPNAGVYQRLIDVFKIDAMPGFLPYEELRARHQPKHRRTFNLPAGRRSVSNLFECPLVQGGIHPTQKPVPLLAELLRLFSNAGDVVLDPFAGSGSAGEACLALGRRFIGIEREAGYYEGMKRRLEGPIQQVLDL